MFTFVLLISFACFYCFSGDDKVSVKEQELELLRQFDFNANYGPCLGDTCLRIIIAIIFIVIPVSWIQLCFK